MYSSSPVNLWFWIELCWRILLTLLYWGWHLMLWWHLRNIFALFLVLQLRCFVSWKSNGKYFMIGHSFWDSFGALSCQSWSIAQQCGAQNTDSHLKLPDWVVRSAGVLECNFAQRWSVAVLCMLFKIKSNPMHPLSGALPLLYVPVCVARGALVAHRHLFVLPPCRTSQYCRMFVPLPVSF